MRTLLGEMDFIKKFPGGKYKEALSNHIYHIKNNIRYK